jgi:hypothetical protein
MHKSVAQNGVIPDRVGLLASGSGYNSIAEGPANDLCQCPHWGYLMSGKIRVIYPNNEEIIRAGDVFYFPPGHTLKVEEAAELIEFSPATEYKQTRQTIARNM